MQRGVGVVYVPLGTRAHRRIVLINKQDELFFSQGASPQRVCDSFPSAEVTAAPGGKQDPRETVRNLQQRLPISTTLMSASLSPELR